MTGRTVISRAVTATLLVTVVALLLSGWLGQPVLLGYVETDSMSPTLQSGDGFIAIPSAVAGPVHQGDVITFRAEVLHGGGLTTHRVIGETNHGYITKGDANPIPDQSGSGEPPVRDEQVVAKVMQVHGNVVVIPQLGQVVTGTQAVLEQVQRHFAGLFGSRTLLGTQGFATLIAIFMLGLYGADVLRESFSAQSKSHERSSKRDTGLNVRILMIVFTVTIVTAMTVGMAAPSGYHEYHTIISDTESATLHVSNSAFIPVVVFLEPGSQKIETSSTRVTVGAHSTEEVTVFISPSQGPQDSRRYLGEHRYFALLPQGVLSQLYRFHPWAPILAIDALIAIPFYLFGVRLVGTDRVRNRSRNSDFSRSTYLRRVFKKLY
jgi:signal peptidase